MKKHIMLTLKPDDGECKSQHGGVCKGVYMLLKGVDRHKSLHMAAREMGMAYSKAWRLMNDVEVDFGEKFVERRGPRGSELTEKGREVMSEYEAIISKLEVFAE